MFSVMWHDSDKVDISDLADQHQIFSTVIRSAANQKNIDISDGTVPRTFANNFSAVMYCLKKWGFREDQLPEKFSLSEVRKLAEDGLIRLKSYHGLVFYSKFDLRRAFLSQPAQPKETKPRIQEKQKAIKSKMAQPKVVKTVVAKPKVEKSKPVSPVKEELDVWYHQDPQLISFTEAAKILEVKMPSLWKWVVIDKIIPYIKYSKRKVLISDVQRLKSLPFFQQKQYSYTEIGSICHVSRQTIRSWVMHEKIQSSNAPGGQKYISAEFLPICQELAKHAKLMNRRNPG